MRLLVVTQAVNTDDPVLGFFHEWIIEMSKKYEKISVVCLFEGKHALPQNVEVYSLGKEKGESYDFQYGQRFLALAWGLRGEYDAVFVHMNQEYVLIAGWLWMLLRKSVYLWRNHYEGGFLTDVASLFCTKIFCTSQYSYTKRFKRTVLMPVGVDTNVFKPTSTPKTGSILSVGRIAPSKRLEVIVEALGMLSKKKILFSAFIYGETSKQDLLYKEKLQKMTQEVGVGGEVQFRGGLQHDTTPPLYSSCEIFVNASKSGMYDKTIFEAAACGALSVASSEDYKTVADPKLSFDGSAGDLARALEQILKLSSEEKAALRRSSMKLAEDNSLSRLVVRLHEAMS